MDGGGISTLSSSVAEAGNYTRWILDVFEPYLGRRVMEVGLGYGNYIPFLKGGDDFLGVDIDADVVALASRLHPKADFMVSDISHAAFVDAIGERRFDTVFCMNVLEHIQDDSAAVHNLLAGLDSGGHLLLLVPAFQSLYNDLDRLAGHVRRYTCTKLVRVLPPAGICVNRLEYFNPIGALGWWAQKFLRHDTLESNRISTQVRLFDRYLLPISRGVNVLTKGWFGQSVICVIRKGECPFQ